MKTIKKEIEAALNHEIESLDWAIENRYWSTCISSSAKIEAFIHVLNIISDEENQPDENQSRD